ncbi:MAG: helix-turn-helix domain-containing protein [Syntrophobacteraceae bacterium]
MDAARRRFGQRLRELREASRKRLKDLAEVMEWSTVYVSDIELGRRNPPSPENIRKMSISLGVDPKELLDLADREMKRVELELDDGRPNRTEMALMLARSWDGLSEEEVTEIKGILNRKDESSDESRSNG